MSEIALDKALSEIHSLRAENEKLRKKAQDFENRYELVTADRAKLFADFTQENDNLKALVGELLDALHEIQMASHVHSEQYTIATEALAKAQTGGV